MAITKAEIRDDIILRLTQAQPTSDFEVPNTQIDRWIDIARDRVVSKYIFNSAKYDGSFIDPTYIKTDSFTAMEAGYIYTIAEPILSTPLNDSSLLRVRVKSVIDATTVRALKVDLFQLDNIETMCQTAPSASKPIVYRKGNIIYFKGFSNVVSDYTVEVDYVQAMTGSTTDYSISEAHLDEITEIAENIGRRELGMLIIDEINDGSQNSQLKQNRR